MGRPEPFELNNPIPGARVASPAAGEYMNPNDRRDFHDYRAKHHEAWASSGLGLVQSRNPCNRLKRLHIRACFRSLDIGIAIYKNRSL